jgi:hypothetical protein
MARFAPEAICSSVKRGTVLTVKNFGIVSPP